MRCRACDYVNAPGAERCSECGAPFAATDTRLHPGETLRDPDDLSLPESTPLLRAITAPEPQPAAAPARSSALAALRRPDNAESDQAVLLKDLAQRLQDRAPEPSVRYAGFLLRFLAFAIDVAVLGFFAFPLAAVGFLAVRAASVVLGHVAAPDVDDTVVTLITGAWFVMAGVYFTMLHRRYGQTIGKSLLGLQVRTVGLESVGAGRSLVRTLGYVASSAFIGAGFLLVAITPRKRGWHDFLAGTCVVRLARQQAAA